MGYILVQYCACIEFLMKLSHKLVNMSELEYESKIRDEQKILGIMPTEIYGESPIMKRYTNKMEVGGNLGIHIVSLD